MRRVLFSIFSFLFAAGVSAQDFSTIAGRVVDQSNNRSLPFASITLKGTNISNVTNSEGIFTLKIPDEIRADSVVISFMGFTSRTLPVSSLSAIDRLMIIPLVPANIAMAAVVVTPGNARDLMISALGKIRDNYSLVPVQMTAFYREMIRKGNTYVALNEAVLDIYKAAYNNYNADQIGIYKIRGNTDNRLDTVAIKYQGGAFSALGLDMAKHTFLGVDIEDLDEHYFFRYGESITINDRYFFCLEFNQLPSLPREIILFRGRIYIDAETLAIGRIESALNIEDKPNAASIFLRRRPTGLRFTPTYTNYIVNYRMAGGKWYYDYASVELRFNTRWDRRLFSSNYTITSEIAITDIRDNPRRVEPETRLRPGDIIASRVNDFTDENFWEDYNIIEPDQTIDNIVSRIIRQLNRRGDE